MYEQTAKYVILQKVALNRTPHSKMLCQTPLSVKDCILAGDSTLEWDINTATVCSFDMISSKLLEAFTGGLCLKTKSNIR